MKRIVAVLAVCFILFGCKQQSNVMDKALLMRQKLLNANACNFDARVTAEYYDKAFTFLLRCKSDMSGDVYFTVIEPESIENINGHISDKGGSFTFDDTVLAFEPLVDDNVSPVLAPWLLIRSLRSGYISHCTQTDREICLNIDDTFHETNLHSEIRIDEQGSLVGAEIYYEGRRILTIVVSNFEML